MIRQVLLKGLLESDNLLWKNIESFVNPQDFWQIVQEHTGFADSTPSLQKLFVQLLITHFEKSLQGSLPNSLKAQFINPGQRAYAIFLVGKFLNLVRKTLLNNMVLLWII